MDSENVKVSVIVATYHRDITLKRALDSLKDQTFRDFEVIVVDDNGSEEWNEKVKRIKDEINDLPIRYICNKKNLGAAESRNEGIRRALGEYVSFLDDDDVYLPEKLEHQYRFMVEGGYDVTLTDLDLYFENGKLSEHRTRDYIEKYDKDSLLRYHLLYHMTGTDTLMFRKDYITKINGFGPQNIGDEFYLMQRAIENGGKIGYLNRCDVKAYVHEGDESLSSGDNKIKGENALFSHKKQYYNQLDKKDVRYITMRHYMVLAFAEMRRKHTRAFLKYGMRAFVTAPVSCIRIAAERIR